MVVAAITTIGAAVATIIAVKTGQGTSAEAPHEAAIPPFISVEPFSGGVITWPLKGFTGTVDNLGPGQTVWGFQQAAGADAFFSTNGPCPVEEGRWTCRDWYIGPGTSDRSQYKLWAAVVTDAQAADLVARLARRSGEPAGAGEEPEHVLDAIDATSGTRDGT